jgi:hypothetical protein
MGLPLARRTRGKVFGCGRAIPLDRAAKFRVWFEALSKPLTPATVRVLGALLWGYHNRDTGLCLPSYESIAEKAGVCRATVARAIEALEDAHVLTWQHRLKWMPKAVAGRIVRVVRRSSNAYRFHDPAPPPANATVTKKQDSYTLAAAPLDPQSPLERVLARFGRALKGSD